MYRAKTLIAHEKYNCAMGANVSGLPPMLLKQFLRDGIVEQVGAPDEAMPGFEDAFQDILTPMSRDELKAVMSENGIGKILKIYQSWTDEQIREAIRSVTPDVNALVIPSTLEQNEPA